MLVSVIVISYNSSPYILDCLNSIYSQDYENIELVISDDCSTDDTISIVNQWVNIHSNRFVNCIVVRGERNSGVAMNCNRGLNQAKGEWIKPIAADDLLSDISSISSYVEASVANPNCNVFFSDVIIFSDVFKQKVYTKYSSIMFAERVTSNTQFRILTKKNILYAPTLFIRKDSLNRINGWDNEFSLCEDIVLYFKLLQDGNKFSYIKKFLVKYRKSKNSLTARYKNSYDLKLVKQQVELLNKYRIKAQSPIVGGMYIFNRGILNLSMVAYRNSNTLSRLLLLAYKINSYILNNGILSLMYIKSRIINYNKYESK